MWWPPVVIERKSNNIIGRELTEKRVSKKSKLNPSGEYSNK